MLETTENDKGLSKNRYLCVTDQTLENERALSKFERTYCEPNTLTELHTYIYIYIFTNVHIPVCISYSLIVNHGGFCAPVFCFEETGRNELEPKGCVFRSPDQDIEIGRRRRVGWAPVSHVSCFKRFRREMGKPPKGSTFPPQQKKRLVVEMAKGKWQTTGLKRDVGQAFWWYPCDGSTAGLCSSSAHVQGEI